MNEQAQDAGHQRSRIIVNMKHQWGWVIRLLLISLMVMIATSLASILLYSTMLENATPDNPPPLGQFVLYIAVLYLVLGSLLVLFGLSYSHRAAGPMVQFENVFARIREGDNTARIHLRAKDHWQDTAEAFNRAMDAVEARLGKA